MFNLGSVNILGSLGLSGFPSDFLEFFDDKSIGSWWGFIIHIYIYKKKVAEEEEGQSCRVKCKNLIPMQLQKSRDTKLLRYHPAIFPNAGYNVCEFSAQVEETCGTPFVL